MTKKFPEDYEMSIRCKNGIKNEGLSEEKVKELLKHRWGVLLRIPHLGMRSIEELSRVLGVPLGRKRAPVVTIDLDGEEFRYEANRVTVDDTDRFETKVIDGFEHHKKVAGRRVITIEIDYPA